MTDTETSGSEAGMGKEFVLSRVIDAPREEVWKAYTEPDRVKQWWGPRHFTAPVVEMDLRVDGKYLYDMRDPEGKDYWSAGVYREVTPPERIVASDYFADEKGNPVPPSYYGLPGDIPQEQMVTITFEEVEGDKTRLTIMHPSSGGASEEDERTGWNESLDKLEENLRMSKAA
jgi:uncharacterized protein YndB with AHSA1/START domain